MRPQKNKRNGYRRRQVFDRELTPMKRHRERGSDPENLEAPKSSNFSWIPDYSLCNFVSHLVRAL
jgi:hypothetical protein